MSGYLCMLNDKQRQIDYLKAQNADLKYRNSKLLWALEKITHQGYDDDHTAEELGVIINRIRGLAFDAITEEKKDN